MVAKMTTDGPTDRPHRDRNGNNSILTPTLTLTLAASVTSTRQTMQKWQDSSYICPWVSGPAAAMLPIL